jgi:adenosylhomocysteine nucleosidase
VVRGERLLVGRMVTGKTWLLVAAEGREFDGILKRFGASLNLNSVNLSWAAQFAREARYRGDRFLMIANGPGPRLVEKALEKKVDVDGMISTGFCGALDESLRVGDIVTGCGILSMDRVVVTAEEKRALRAKTGAAAVEMESAAVAAKAEQWGVPFRCIRVVSDAATEDLPLDFNLYRDAEGRFSRARITLAALARPFSRVPALLRLEHNTKIAARSLGDYFADCRL